MTIAFPTDADTFTPYGNFAFHVAFEWLGSGDHPGKDVPDGVLGGFSEITGLEATMEHKVIKAGGRNYGPAMRAGPVSFGTVVMKRGIINSPHMWRWWSIFAGSDGAADGRPLPVFRCNVLIALLNTIDNDFVKLKRAAEPGADVKIERKLKVGWKLRNAMPVKFRVGDLNAKGSDVAVEELHLVHEGLEMKGVVK